MASFYLRRLLFLALAIGLVASQDGTDIPKSITITSAAAAPSSSSLSIRATTYYLVSEAGAGEPVTVGTTIVLETVMPTTVGDLNPATKVPGPSSLSSASARSSRSSSLEATQAPNPNSPTGAGPSTAHNSSARTVLQHTTGFLGVAGLLVAFLLR